MPSLTEDDILALLPKPPKGPEKALAGQRDGRSAWRQGRDDGVPGAGERRTSRPHHGQDRVSYRLGHQAFPVRGAGDHRRTRASSTSTRLCRPICPDMQPAPGSATVRQAMNNTSGIRDHLELWYIAGGGLQVPHRLRRQHRGCARRRKTPTSCPAAPIFIPMPISCCCPGSSRTSAGSLWRNSFRRALLYPARHDPHGAAQRSSRGGRRSGDRLCGPRQDAGSNAGA